MDQVRGHCQATLGCQEGLWAVRLEVRAGAQSLQATPRDTSVHELVHQASSRNNKIKYPMFTSQVKQQNISCTASAVLCLPSHYSNS